MTMDVLPPAWQEWAQYAHHSIIAKRPLKIKQEEIILQYARATQNGLPCTNGMGRLKLCYCFEKSLRRRLFGLFVTLYDFVHKHNMPCIHEPKPATEVRGSSR
ncbi:MAG: hypothetical protein ACERKO_10020, partial [Acetanaerobacterium sp.]